jgi:hypothetical protein
LPHSLLDPQEIDDDTYALGQPRPDAAITPFFETIDELEQFCEDEIEACRLRITVM